MKKECIKCVKSIYDPEYGYSCGLKAWNHFENADKCPYYKHEQKVYYAHHQFKYGTKTEQYEIDLIARKFPNCKIFNPSTDISQSMSTPDIMRVCISKVNKSDVLVFSSLSGVVGNGVYEEVYTALKNKIKIYYIYNNRLHRKRFVNFKKLNSKNDRVYAIVK